MKTLRKYLDRAVEMGASDIFVVAGGSVSIKLDSVIQDLEDSAVMPGDTEKLIQEIYQLAHRDISGYLASGDDDFSFAVPGLSRFRVNTYRQRSSMAAVIRVVPFQVPQYADYNIPEQVMDLADLKSGMIIISGTAGSGKSTTQTCIIDRINHTRSSHIITLEDPIEHLHRNDKSIISQREISIDTRDYTSALRACLRQAPDVILLGEMRDSETMQVAMTAAETGHLLIGTLHTQGTVHSIDRIIDSFPAAQQSQVRMQLSMILQAVVSQQLLPDVQGGQVPAFEIMRVNSAIRNMIRDNKTYQVDNVIQTSGDQGMISMDESILRLYNAGHISADTALTHAMNVEQMQRRLQR